MTQPITSFIRRRSLALERAAALGYTVKFVPFVEDAQTPGMMLGRTVGVTIPDLKLIKIRTHSLSKKQIIAALEHELEHAEGNEWGTNHPDLGLTCGGMRPLNCL